MLCTVWTRNNLNCVAYKCPLSLVYPTHFFQVRQRWLSKTVSPTGLGMMKAVKTYVDPQNIFASGNLFTAVPKAKLWIFQLVRCNMLNRTLESTSRRNSVFQWHNGLYFNEMGFDIMSRLQFHFKLGFKVKLVLFVHNGADHSVLFHRAWLSPLSSDVCLIAYKNSRQVLRVLHDEMMKWFTYPEHCQTFYDYPRISFKIHTFYYRKT